MKKSKKFSMPMVMQKQRTKALLMHLEMCFFRIPCHMSCHGLYIITMQNRTSSVPHLLSSSCLPVGDKHPKLGHRVCSNYKDGLTILSWGIWKFHRES